MRLSAVILAGGRSRRMAREKALLPAAGHGCLLHRQIAVAESLAPREILVSCRPEQRLPVPPGARRVHDDGGAGPLGGVAAALDAMRGDALLVLAVDLARMTPWLLRRIAGAAGPGGLPGVIPKTTRGIEPLAAVLPRAARNAALGRLAAGEWALHALARDLEAQGLVRWCAVADYDLPAFANWNHPADLRRSVGR